MRWVSREPPYDRVSETLTIGRRLLPRERVEGIANWVDLTAEFDEPEAVRRDTNYVCLPILDGDVPRAEELVRALDSLKAGPTYIHCAQGHGRTGLFAVAWLLRQGEITALDQGLALLRSARPALSLNARQMRFLVTYMTSMGSGAPVSPQV